jgi:hypothetical protein
MFRVRLGFGMAYRAAEYRVVRGIGMAIATDSGGVVSPREPAVSERRSRPARSVVAGCTGGCESCCDMIRIGYASIYRRVTRIAVLRSSCKLIIEMTLIAHHSGVLAG